MRTFLDITTIVSFLMLGAYNEESLKAEIVWYLSWMTICVGSVLINKWISRKEADDEQ